MDTMLKVFKVDDETYVKIKDSPTKVRRRKFITDAIRDSLDLKGKHGFDFGAGVGVVMDILREDGAIMTGCDISPIIAAEGKGVEVGGVEVLEKIAPQDFIIAASVLQLMPPEEREAFWSLAKKNLKPGGIVFVVLGNERRNSNYKKKELGLADPEAYPRSIETKGFRHIGTRYTKILPPKWQRALRRLGVPMPDFIWSDAGLSKTELNERAYALMFVFQKA